MVQHPHYRKYTTDEVCQLVRDLLIGKSLMTHQIVTKLQIPYGEVVSALNKMGDELNYVNKYGWELKDGPH